jgi:putative Mn2+ efflux pump MntP
MNNDKKNQRVLIAVNLFIFAGIAAWVFGSGTFNLFIDAIKSHVWVFVLIGIGGMYMVNFFREEEHDEVDIMTDPHITDAYLNKVDMIDSYLGTHHHD